jgi:hypothetical protein
MKKIMPYVLPVLSILFMVLFIAIYQPRITGYSIRENSSSLNFEVKVSAVEVLPKDAVISIRLLDKKNNTLIELEKENIGDLVQKGSLNLSYIQGFNSQINYRGYGYLGESKINISKQINKDIEDKIAGIKVEITYNNEIISSSEQEKTFVSIS